MIVHHIAGGPKAFAAFMMDDDQEVRVRYVRRRPVRWHCDIDGHHESPECAHEIAAFLAILRREDS